MERERGQGEKGRCRVEKKKSLTPVEEESMMRAGSLEKRRWKKAIIPWGFKGTKKFWKGQRGEKKKENYSSKNLGLKLDQGEKKDVAYNQGKSGGKGYCNESYFLDKNWEKRGEEKSRSSWYDSVILIYTN